MRRGSKNLRLYRITCEQVFERAGGHCEVMVDDKGKACTVEKKHRCNRYIPFDACRWINFLHTETRNGKSDEWVLNPNNVVYGCEAHHVEEEQTGIRVEHVEILEGTYYSEPIDL